MNTATALVTVLIIINMAYSVWATIILAGRIEKLEKWRKRNTGDNR